MVPIAVASEKRSTIFPEVPTLKEKGWDVVMVQWRSVLAPKGTPAERIGILAEAFQKAMAADSWKTSARLTSGNSLRARTKASSRSSTSWDCASATSCHATHFAAPPATVADWICCVFRAGGALFSPGPAAPCFLARIRLPEPGELSPDLRPREDPPYSASHGSLGNSVRPPLRLLRQQRGDHADGPEGRSGESERVH